MASRSNITAAEEFEQRKEARRQERIEKQKMRDNLRKHSLRLLTDTGYQYGWEVGPSVDSRFWVMRCNQVVIDKNGDEPIQYFANACPRSVVFEYTNFRQIYGDREIEIMQRAKLAGMKGKPTFYNVELKKAFEGEWKRRFQNSLARFFVYCKENKLRPTIKSEELLFALTANKGVVPDKK